MRQQYMLAQKLPLSIWSYRTAIQADKGFNKYRFLPNKIEMVQMEFFLTQLKIFLFTGKLFTLNAILLLIRNFSSTVMLLRV